MKLGKKWPENPPAPASTWEGPRWEYREISGDIQLLNHLGREGWEVVNVAVGDGRTMIAGNTIGKGKRVYLLKREVL